MSQAIIGRVINNRFQVEAFVASGGMKTVYKVRDLERSAPLAMKMLHGDLEEDPAVLHSFQRETNAIKKLSHPNIVRFYGMGEFGGNYYMLEEFIDGPSLKDIIKDRKILPIEESLAYFRALCAALGFAHNNGVIHCDVKPGNVMIDQGGNVLLTDFGIARHSGSDSTSTFAGAGTPGYMAPEQVRRRSVTPETDIYALGVMLYEMLTGQRPFKGTEPWLETAGGTQNERIRYAHLKVQPPDPRSLNPQISEKLAAAMLKALAKNPQDRFCDAQQFLKAVCEGAGFPEGSIPLRVVPPRMKTDVFGAPPAELPQVTPPPTQKLGGEKPLWMLGGGLIAGFVVIGGIGVIAVLYFLLRAFLPAAPAPTPYVSRGLDNQPTATIALPGSSNPITATDAPEAVLPVFNTPAPVEPPTATMAPAAPTATTAPSSTPVPPTPIPPTATTAPVFSNVVTINAGSFLMGATGRDQQVHGYSDKFQDELPEHSPYLHQYSIDLTEVTNRQFAEFVNQTGYRTTAEQAGSAYVTSMDKEIADLVPGANWRHPRGPGTDNGGDNYPVSQVSWYDADSYCRWAGGALPSEAQWEKAARGTDGRVYPWGNAELTGSYANTADAALNSSWWSDNGVNDGVRFLSPVGVFSSGASPYGLQDMAGNAWEWVSDWYDPGYYSTSEASMNDPYGPSSGTKKVMRGGSYINGRKNVRAARRGNNTPDSSLDVYGFRCVYP